jgi:hypothetical protein
MPNFDIGAGGAHLHLAFHWNINTYSFGPVAAPISQGAGALEGSSENFSKTPRWLRGFVQRVACIFGVVWFRCIARKLLDWNRAGYWVICDNLAMTMNKLGQRSLPRGRFDLSISRTISTVCSISRTHPEPSSLQTGLTSIDMVCHDASNSLCPSSKLDIPAFPLQGSNFKKGVKFSVHTTSCGRVPWSRCRLGNEELVWCPSGWNDMTGRIVFVESMKFNDAQNKPESAFVRVNHLANALIPN